MFGIGFPELIIILIVALIVFGPAKLPELAGSIGKAMRELKRVTDDVKQSLESETDSVETAFKTSDSADTAPETTDLTDVYAATHSQEKETEKKYNL